MKNYLINFKEGGKIVWFEVVWEFFYNCFNELIVMSNSFTESITFFWSNIWDEYEVNEISDEETKILTTLFSYDGYVSIWKTVSFPSFIMKTLEKKWIWEFDEEKFPNLAEYMSI